MQVLERKTRLEVLENRMKRNLGRQLTPREKFYLAMAEACAPTEPAAEEVLPETARAIRRSHRKFNTERDGDRAKAA